MEACPAVRARTRPRHAFPRAYLQRPRAARTRSACSHAPTDKTTVASLGRTGKSKTKTRAHLRFSTPEGPGCPPVAQASGLLPLTAEGDSAWEAQVSTCHRCPNKSYCAAGCKTGAEHRARVDAVVLLGAPPSQARARVGRGGCLRAKRALGGPEGHPAPKPHRTLAPRTYPAIQTG